jgi:hypothetical protein
MLIVSDNSIFRAQFDKNLASKIGEAVLPLGLPSSSLEAMIENLVLQNSTGLADIPGATNEIISAGLNGMQEAYILGFRYVWVAAGCFTALAAICECPVLYDIYHTTESEKTNLFKHLLTA